MIYLSHTRLDIAYVVGVVSQFIHAPLEDHSEAIIRILRYPKATPSMGLLFSENSHIQVEAHIDANYVGSIIGRRST